MFVTSPLSNASSNCAAFSSSTVTSSSLSPSSPPRSLPSFSLPMRIARLRDEALDNGSTAAPKECEANELVFGGGLD